MAVEYSWDTPVRELWNKASSSQPDMPDYQKLLALANLKLADRMARYTLLLSYFTGALLLIAVIQLVTALCQTRH